MTIELDELKTTKMKPEPLAKMNPMQKTGTQKNTLASSVPQSPLIPLSLAFCSSLLFFSCACTKRIGDAESKRGEVRDQKSNLLAATSASPKASAEGAEIHSDDMPEKMNAPKDMRGLKRAGGDPENGDFTLDEATAHLPQSGSGAWLATIETSMGSLACKLFADKAPKTVANFIGLARGLRPWLWNGEWVKKPIYDGTTFHRIIKGFMIQGGDPKGDGTGEPGYVVDDEIWPGAKHDKAGLLCMANRGPNTNGAQFFITDAKASHLDGNYTIFGECAPESVVHAIAQVSTRASDNRPLQPIVIKRVQITYEK